APRIGRRWKHAPDYLEPGSVRRGFLASSIYGAERSAACREFAFREKSTVGAAGGGSEVVDIPGRTGGMVGLFRSTDRQRAHDVLRRLRQFLAKPLRPLPARRWP